MFYARDGGIFIAQLRACHREHFLESRPIHRVILYLLLDLQSLPIDTRFVVQESGSEYQIARDSASRITFRTEHGQFLMRPSEFNPCRIRMARERFDNSQPGAVTRTQLFCKILWRVERLAQGVDRLVVFALKHPKTDAGKTCFILPIDSVPDFILWLGFTDDAAVLYAAIVSLVVTRELPLREVPNILYRTAVVSSALLLVVGTAMIFSWVASLSGVTARLGAFMFSVTEIPSCRASATSS